MSTLSQLLVAVPFVLLGLTAPFGTTILGVVAIRQIKRSKGQLYGMPLAVFDALVFPLLAVNLVVLAVGGLVSALLLTLILGREVPTGLSENGAYGLIFLLDLLLFAGPLAWIDWRIVRGVWRNATGYQAPPKHAACISATIAADGGEMLPEEGRWETWWLRRSRADSESDRSNVGTGTGDRPDRIPVREGRRGAAPVGRHAYVLHDRLLGSVVSI